MMQEKRSWGIKEVREFLKERNHANQILELSDSARTAQLAADAVGTSVAQIVKSLIFKGKSTHSPILVLASGANRVDERKIAALVNEPVEKPDADFVRNHTGYAIGGVPPFPHPNQMMTFIDADLMQYEQIWAAAGHPNAVFPLTPAELASLSSGTVVDVAK